MLLGRLGHLEAHLLGTELIADALEHQVDDLGDLLDRQRAEDDRRIDPVEELRPEVLLELDLDLLLHEVVGDLGAAMRRCRRSPGSRGSSWSGAASRRGWRS